MAVRVGATLTSVTVMENEPVVVAVPSETETLTV